VIDFQFQCHPVDNLVVLVEIQIHQIVQHQQLQQVVEWVQPLQQLLPLLLLHRNMLVLFVVIKHQANITECIGLFIEMMNQFFF
jgi:hypothetical protein